MSESKPLSVAELLARNGKDVGSSGGGRRRRGGRGLSVSDLTGDLPVVSPGRRAHGAPDEEESDPFDATGLGSQKSSEEESGTGRRYRREPEEPAEPNEGRAARRRAAEAALPAPASEAAPPREPRVHNWSIAPAGMDSSHRQTPPPAETAYAADPAVDPMGPIHPASIGPVRPDHMRPDQPRDGEAPEPRPGLDPRLDMPRRSRGGAIRPGPQPWDGPGSGNGTEGPPPASWTLAAQDSEPLPRRSAPPPEFDAEPSAEFDALETGDFPDQDYYPSEEFPEYLQTGEFPTGGYESDIYGPPPRYDTDGYYPDDEDFDEEEDLPPRTGIFQRLRNSAGDAAAAARAKVEQSRPRRPPARSGGPARRKGRDGQQNELLVLGGQIGGAALAGMVLFKGFEWLWAMLPWLALVLSIAVIVGLVTAVRMLRRTDDIASIGIAVGVGAFVTLGPLAFLLSAG